MVGSAELMFPTLVEAVGGSSSARGGSSISIPNSSRPRGEVQEQRHSPGLR